MVGSVIFDMHMHVDEVPALGWSMPASLCVESMDRAGIGAAGIMTITDMPAVNPHALELIVEACAAYPGRLYGFIRVHPWYGEESLSILERAVTRHGFRALKLHPVSTMAHPAGEESLRLIQRAAELGVPTLFHCGDDPMTTPEAIAAAAAACPTATIILGHMGGYAHTEDAIRVAERLPNVMLETSASPYPDAIVDAVRRVGARRVLFGSDGPGCLPELEVEKIRMCGLREDEERQVLGLNALELLGIPA